MFTFAIRPAFLTASPLHAALLLRFAR